MFSAKTSLVLLLSVCASASAQLVSITEYLTAPGNGPWEITTGPDGALWFTELQANKIGRITTAGAITEFVVPTSSSGPRSIVAGPDGALWFTEEAADKIGRITTSGAITEYPIPTTGGQTAGITAGPDGALWFTEQNANQIGRITTGGSVTQYPIPTPNSHPLGIAAGPDGALWFAEFESSKIGRISTSGALSEYSIPTTNSEPYGIAAGPDGALWFTESIADQIGRISIAGSISEYGIPTSNSVPLGIAAGPNNSLWFAESDPSANQIGLITTAGAISEYPISSANSYPAGITAGPDGAMWFTEFLGGAIGRAALRPAFSITKTHSADFVQGQTNAQYNVTVTNNGAGSSSGTVAVTDNVPAGLTLISMSGSGWNCASSTCTRNDELPIGATFPPIAVIVSVAVNAPSAVANQATVSGGGSLPATATDVTAVDPNAGASSVSNVTASPSNGSYRTGQSISIQVSFSGPVTVTGSPQLALNSGGTATYSSGSGSPALYFIYIVGTNDSSAHLDYQSTGALTLDGGTIQAANLGNALLILPPPGTPGSLGANTTIAIGIGLPAPFFTGQISLGNGIYYLQLANGNVFGYYNLQSFPILYHYDLGFESFIDAHNSTAGAYLYDFTSGHWFYTDYNLFPYLYDFTLNSWLYYFPDTKNPGHYTTNPRYFSNLGTGKIFTM